MKKILFFSAPWCGSCKILKPRINSLESGGLIEVEHLNSDNNPDLAIEYKIKNIPTVILLENGEEVDRFTGAKNKEQILEFYNR